MKPPLWSPQESEIDVPYDEAERKKYAENQPSCVYHNVRWNPKPLKAKDSTPPGRDYWAKEIGGRGKYGEFPGVVVREHYRGLGYTVWASEPRLVNPTTGEPEGYVAISYPGARDPRHRHHHAYCRMLAI